jgi:hypothetical protein
VNWSRAKETSTDRERFGERRLSHAGEVLDDQVALGDEAEDAVAQRLFRRVDDAGEIRGDPGELLRSVVDGRPRRRLLAHVP